MIEVIAHRASRSPGTITAPPDSSRHPRKGRSECKPSKAPGHDYRRWATLCLFNPRNRHTHLTTEPLSLARRDLAADGGLDNRGDGLSDPSNRLTFLQLERLFVVFGLSNTPAKGAP